MKAVADIGARLELFVDEWLIEERRGVAMKLHAPLRKEIVMRFDKPWEGISSAFSTVIQEKDKIRLYYRGSSHLGEDGKPGEDTWFTCYAESTDGIHFTRPNLGQIEFAGDKNNNIIWKEGLIGHNFAPFVDDAPNVPSDELYKAIGGKKGKIFGLISGDGITWNYKQNEPVMSGGSGYDSLNTMMWDPNKQAYICFSRMKPPKLVGEAHALKALAVSTSTDFCKWGQRQFFQYSDMKPLSNPTDNYYTNSIILCPEAEHIYLGFPMRFVRNRSIESKLNANSWQRKSTNEAVSDTIFISSRDGILWDRTFGEAWCRPGRDIDNWTQARSGIVSKGCVQLAPDEFTFYIHEALNKEGNRLRRMTIRKHGFGSVHAGYETGEFVTRPILFKGGKLIVNYSTSAAGYIRAELLDESGRCPLPGFTLNDMDPVYGDEIEGLLEWKDGADPRIWEGKPVRLRIQMKDADLFSLKWN